MIFAAWAAVAVYFCVLSIAVGFEVAVAGTVIFVFWATRFTFNAIMAETSARRREAAEAWQPPRPDPSQPVQLRVVERD